MNYGMWLSSSGQIFYQYYNSGYNQCTGSGAVPLGTWTYVTVVVDEGAGTKIAMYLNGSLDGTPTYSGTMTANGNPDLQIGNYGQYSGGSFQFNGSLDEVRISNLAQSSNWVWATYMNSASNGTFNSYEAVQVNPANLPQVSNASGATNVTLTDAWINGTLVTNGASDTTVLLYWGASDGGTNGGPAYWAYTNTWAAPQLPGNFTTNVAMPSSNTVYYYRFAASNSYGWGWAPTSSVFMTSPVWVQKSSDGAEQGLVPGTFTVYRASIATNAAITVNCAIGGSGVAGLDYANNLGGTVTFAVGASSATIVVSPLVNNASNADSTVALTILPGAYVVGTPSNATLTIANWPLPVGPFNFYVNASGGDNTRAIQLATNSATPWKTVTYALSQASSGDTINVAAGLYTTTFETFPLTMKNGVTPQGAGWMTTTIDAASLGTDVIDCLGLASGKIDGFTVKGASSNGKNGIYLSGVGSLVISNNRITGNSAGTYRGAGIAVNGTGTTPLIKNNLIVGNSSGDRGGGIYIDDWAGSRPSPTIVNNTIVGNANGGIVGMAGTPTIRDCIIWGNGPYDLNNIQASQIANCVIRDGKFNGVNGCTNADPLFVSGYLLSQKAAGQSVDSPCLNAGSQSATTAGLNGLSTRTDGVSDSGQVDIGYHFPAGTTYGVDVYISAATGNDTYTLSQATNPATPWKSITKALNQVDNYSWRIHVAAGRYVSPAETFPLNMVQGVQLLGAGALSTTIDVQRAAVNAISCSWVGIGLIDGFTIRGAGVAGAGTGGACGISLGGPSCLTISHNIITDNREGWEGGGIRSWQAGPILMDNLIVGNYANGGGNGSGGGVYLYDNYGAQLINNTIVSNSSPGKVGGVQFYSQSASPRPIIKNCIIWGNGTDLDLVQAADIDHCEISDGQFNTTNNCSSADPQFKGAGDYRLKASSPCVRAGVTEAWMIHDTDLDGQPRKSGSQVDMGAYELRGSGTSVFFH